MTLLKHCLLAGALTHSVIALALFVLRAEPAKVTMAIALAALFLLWKMALTDPR